MKTPSDYWQAINAATLAGLDHFAAALLAMYCRECPQGPRPKESAQAIRQRAKDAHNPFRNDN